MEALIISIDVDKERISLGIKQLTENPNPESEVKANDESEKPAKKVAKKTVKKDALSDEPKNAGTTSLGALLKAKLDDKK